MAANPLLSTLVTGLILLAIVVVAVRLRRWRRADARADAETSLAVIDRLLHSPTTWVVGFLVLVLVAVAGTLALVGAVPLPEGVQPAVTTVLIVGSALVLGGFVFGGVYASVRGRGYGSAPAVGLGSLVVGLLALLVIVVQLLLG